MARLSRRAASTSAILFDTFDFIRLSMQHYRTFGLTPEQVSFDRCQNICRPNITKVSRSAAMLMTTDPGDLVLDPTCGSGTTAYVAEQWGRRWITIDTSRVALALARARIMGARYPYYLLADSPEGRQKEAEIIPDGTDPQPDGRRYSPRFRLRTGTAHHACVHCQQCGDRCHLGEVPRTIWSLCGSS